MITENREAWITREEDRICEDARSWCKRCDAEETAAEEGGEAREPCDCEKIGDGLRRHGRGKPGRLRRCAARLAARYRHRAPRRRHQGGEARRAHQVDASRLFLERPGAAHPCGSEARAPRL